MDKSTPKQRADHVLNSIARIKSFIKDVNEERFLKDIQLQSAVQYQFLVIGEAIRNIDRSVLEKYDYPWHIPLSFRNFIAHRYHSIKMERVFYATQDLDTLENKIKELIENEF
jgi:uncharacterized protein with HEPN domain